MKKILFIFITVALYACSESALTPKVDTANEYEAKLRERATQSDYDAQIWDWYQNYQTAFVYDFTQEEFSWLWSSKFTDSYEQFDLTQPDDVAKLSTFVKAIQHGFITKYSHERLATTLPFRVFLCKKLNPAVGSFSDKDTISTTNGQDAIIVGYENKKGVPYDETTLANALSKSFALFFFNKLPYPPTEFIESRTECNYNLVTIPADPAIEGEFTSTPYLTNDTNSPTYKSHRGYVCGYIRSYLPTYVQVPTEQVDFADYLAFLTCNSAEYIRTYTKNYWRIAKRASIFIKYWKEAMGEDLIESHAQQNPDEKFPLSASDFTYVEK